MIQARRRADLKESGLLIPLKMVDTGKIIHVQADKWMHASQPDELDDSQWNVLIYSYRNGKDSARELIALGMSIDFDFGDDIEY